MCIIFIFTGYFIYFYTEDSYQFWLLFHRIDLRKHMLLPSKDYLLEVKAIHCWYFEGLYVMPQIGPKRSLPRVTMEVVSFVAHCNPTAKTQILLLVLHKLTRRFIVQDQHYIMTAIYRCGTNHIMHNHGLTA